LVVSTADPLRSYWTATEEISPWERTVSASCSADDLSRLSSRIEWLEHRVEMLMKQLEEVGLTDVSDLI
jgi:hypothetical protein